MCFSATASFIAGGGLVAAGIATAKQAKTPDRLPIALMPLLFGVQQLLEGVVWVSGELPILQSQAAFLYVMFSHVLWPTYVPLAVMSLEPPGRRRTFLKGLLVLGVAISIWLFVYIYPDPVTATLTARGCLYDMTLPAIPYGLAAYVLVTCLSFFISRHKWIRLLGIAMVGALILALWAYRQAFYSTWCFFAAILSLVIYVQLSDLKDDMKEMMVKAEAAVRERLPGNGD